MKCSPSQPSLLLHTQTLITSDFGLVVRTLCFMPYFPYSVFLSLVVRAAGLHHYRSSRDVGGKGQCEVRRKRSHPTCRKLSPCFSVQTDWSTGTSSALLHWGMMEAGYFKLEVSKRPPCGKTTDRPLLFESWHRSERAA